MICPAFEDLLALRAFPDAHLAQVRRTELQQHVDAGCERCARRLSLASRLSRSIGSLPLNAAPATRLAGLVERARAIPSALQAVGHSILTLLPEATPAAGALRGEASAEPHWLFRGSDWELDLAVLEPGVLAGQLLASDGRALEDGACVLHSDQGAEQTLLESTGEFLFEGLAPERYALLVDVEGLSISVPDIDLTGGSGAL